MRQQNNWYAISGVASSGKTTIINLLEQKGYKVLHESATEFVLNQIKKGFSIEDLRKNESVFQETIFQLKIFYESLLDPNETVFIDRGLPDSIAFWKLYNLPMKSDIENAIKNSSYKKVFLFERLPLVKEEFRPEPEEEISIMDKYNKEAYENLGHNIVNVPVMSVENRLKFVLENI